MHLKTSKGKKVAYSLICVAFLCFLCAFCAFYAFLCVKQKRQYFYEHKKHLRRKKSLV